MASNPPFHVEDQTDEDFFDKLVEDDVELIKSGRDEGNHTDDAKAFANLSIGDSDAAFENMDFGKSGIETEEEKGRVDFDRGATSAQAEEGNSLVSSSSGGCDSMIESTDDGIGTEFTSDSTVSKSNRFNSAGVKEVGWNSFHADSVQNGGHGFGSYSDFFNELGDDSGVFPGKVSDNLRSEVKSSNEVKSDGLNNSVKYVQYQQGQGYDASLEQSTNEQDLDSSQYWENLYPGWKYDSNTGQWYQVDDYNATAAAQGSFDSNAANSWSAASDGKEVSFMQQAFQNGNVGTVTETGISGSVSDWNQVSQGTSGYPEHMVFDPQYPGWYYDTIAQEWRLLETFNSSIQSMVQGHENGHVSTGTFTQNVNSFYDGSQGLDSSRGGSYGNNQQQGLNMHATSNGAKSEPSVNFVGNQQLDNPYGSKISLSKDQQNSSNSFGAVPLYNKSSSANGTAELQRFIPGGDIVQQFDYSNVKLDEQKQFSNDYGGSQKAINYSQQSFQGGHQFSYAPNVERSAAGQQFDYSNVNEQKQFSNDYGGTQNAINYSQQSFQGENQFSYAPHMERTSAGRPPHALVTFGFGGKLIVMKDSSSLNSSYGSQDTVQGSVSVLNLMEVFTENSNASSIRTGTCDYFRALCQLPFPGPLVGGSVGSKELNKWIDERIANCESPDMDYQKRERLRLLLSLLKIACQHYGKLRSPFGTDTIQKENDTPESAVAKLFASARRSGAQFSEYGVLSHCLLNQPSEGQMRATASEVQNLLVSGRKKDALQCAQGGQLWGPALVLASQLGDQLYVDTVKQMALQQLVAGSPLRTLCLLIAGQPAEVFSADTSSGITGAADVLQQPAQFRPNSMLDGWEENLAVITANRTKDDELVIIHLGDCLWKERSEITAAHICYLVAEANFESYSDSARLCLIGADHWKFPRTYASPEAIQRTELYEYSKVLGNSQFILLPFQPYKLIYAHMLAEVGKVSDSLKYCQALLKSLKTGRAPEVETWKQLISSLEERIRTHQQGGYTANLAPAKLVGKLLNFFDSTAHRVVGGLPPSAPSTSQGNVQGNEQYHPPVGPRVLNSQSTMAMSSLIPSASMEPISGWTSDGNRTTMPNRSVSEPDFGRSPRQETTSTDAQGKSSVSIGASRFSRFGFGSQFLQKTVGLVLRPRPGRQAKLGETNKFYYDEKLKRWVEEGVEPPAEEAALPPPPTTNTFQNGTPEYNLKSALQKEGSPSKESPGVKTSSPLEHASGIPPIPPSSNQFSSRGRIGVRSRYVDTFNQGGANPGNLFQSPSLPAVKPAIAANAKFFIPSPASSTEQPMEAIAESLHEDSAANEDHSTSNTKDTFQSPLPSSSMARQRFPSMDNISSKGAMKNSSGSISSHSRRTASWSGSFNDTLSHSHTRMGEIKPQGEGIPPSPFTPNEPPLIRMHNSGSFGEDLHEVEL
ncbi:Protein transport protein sec16 [Quillaja saponaria]|uniref:Protein transport protein sec16 n=1 Tax=Quillaja saponaria TaxID=32244 RepID=A0AAD7L6S3_QUISA|nr:Protein transport protein sec16 [Quillaja saponaria]